MAISITTGYTIPANETAPGVLNMWILNEEVAQVTPATGGPITAFNTAVGTTPAWYKFQCDNSEGQVDFNSTSGSGGREFTSSITYRTGGLNQTTLTNLDNLTKSARMGIVIEGRDGKFTYYSYNGFTTSSTTGTTGVGGGGATATGITYTFTAQDGRPPAEVTVATTLDAITDALT